MNIQPIKRGYAHRVSRLLQATDCYSQLRTGRVVAYYEHPDAARKLINWLTLADIDQTYLPFDTLSMLSLDRQFKRGKMPSRVELVLNLEAQYHPYKNALVINDQGELLTEAAVNAVLNNGNND